MVYTLAQLRGFVAVAEHGHFGRAAQSLLTSQPSLSRQVQGLERAVGVSLFERGPRGVQLTVAGHVFLRDARRILSLSEGAPETARRVAAGRAGRIQVAFISAAALSTLEPLLTEISFELAQLEVALVELSGAEQLQALADGRIDLGLVRPPVPTEEFDAQAVHAEPLIVALPVGHHLAEKDGPIAADDLIDEPILEYAEDGTDYLHDLCVRLLGSENFVAAQRVSQLSTALALVRARRGIALVPRSAAAMRFDGVIHREVAGSSPLVTLHACWRRDTMNPALINVIAYLRARLQP
ncbi:LysR family transcriptional regulator [Occultella glacieicola]|uniref:LysR family transcriptional regulator n=1 Tax=Occultella glacieicola TaxID=2518684 RepID=A0ABY2EAJ1_9MICO|nr:LysR substrate-binding domain-containing protein [Occultella glacieicola]TDE98965.1 LysR family transcriptional regulator [Occultella glacieicola]